jgi:hypothetical protein
MIDNNITTPRLTLSVDVTDLSDENRLLFTEQVTDLLSNYLDSDEKEAESTVLGWTRATLDEALSELDRDGSWVQAGVIRRALQNGGTATRDEVYEIGKYDQTRMLRGFTRPVNRIVSRMRAKGVIPASAVDLLKPIYEGVQAIGFSVPTELVNLAG